MRSTNTRARPTKWLGLPVTALLAGALLLAGCDAEHTPDTSVLGPTWNLAEFDLTSVPGTVGFRSDLQVASTFEFAPQSDIEFAATVFNTDYTTAGVGGLRNVGSGTIALSGVDGPVTHAALYWHSVTNTSDAALGETVFVNGVQVTGVHLGFSSDNCWGFQNSQAWAADVTDIVQAQGNGDYALSDFGGFPTANPNGASLIVFYDDGDPDNNRDAVLFEGNDSNIPNPYDADGWNVTLAGINYTAGTVNMQLHVADGQQFSDDALILNGAVLQPSGIIFGGFSVPGDNDGPSRNGRLWDIMTWDVTAWMEPGENTLELTTGVVDDCLALVVAVVDLPAGAAPEQPPEGPAPPPVEGDATEACTPGYWGQPGIGQGHWPAGYEPSDAVSDVFWAAMGYLGSSSLHEALDGYRESETRRNTLDGAREILLRSAVAAVLNEASFGAAYPATSVASLAADVNDALQNGTRAEILDLATLLDWWNNNYEVDADGNLVLDEQGHPVKRGTCPL
jgi:hypothetical protein